MGARPRVGSEGANYTNVQLYSSLRCSQKRNLLSKRYLQVESPHWYGPSAATTFPCFSNMSWTILAVLLRIEAHVRLGISRLGGPSGDYMLN